MILHKYLLKHTKEHENKHSFSESILDMKNQQIYMLSEEGIKVLVEQITENIKKVLNLSNSATEDVFMNIDETAKLINLAKPSIYGLVHQNKIPYHKKGKRLYFLKSQIIDWLKSGKKDSKDDTETKANEYLMKNQLFNR